MDRREFSQKPGLGALCRLVRGFVPVGAGLCVGWCGALRRLVRGLCVGLFGGFAPTGAGLCAGLLGALCRLVRSFVSACSGALRRLVWAFSGLGRAGLLRRSVRMLLYKAGAAVLRNGDGLKIYTGEYILYLRHFAECAKRGFTAAFPARRLSAKIIHRRLCRDVRYKYEGIWSTV